MCIIVDCIIKFGDLKNVYVFYLCGCVRSLAVVVRIFGCSTVSGCGQGSVFVARGLRCSMACGRLDCQGSALDICGLVGLCLGRSPSSSYHVG